MIYWMGPRDTNLTEDEETVEILEIIEQCEDYSDLDESYIPEYYEEY